MAPAPATSRPFAASHNLLLLARVAETWKCRPSELLGISHASRNLTPALQIDFAAAVALWRSRAAVEMGEHDEWW